MKNTYKLIWTEEALNGLKAIFNYLEHKFTEKEIRKFTNKLKKHLELLRNSPETFAFANHTKGIRRTIIAKLTSIYYRIEGNEVKIISVI